MWDLKDLCMCIGSINAFRQSHVIMYTFEGSEGVGQSSFMLEGGNRRSGVSAKSYIFLIATVHHEREVHYLA